MQGTNEHEQKKTSTRLKLDYKLKMRSISNRLRPSTKRPTLRLSVSALRPPLKTDMSRRVGVGGVRAAAPQSSCASFPPEAKSLPALGKLSLASASTGDSPSAVGANGASEREGGPGEPPTKLADWRLRSFEETEVERRLFSLLDELPVELRLLVVAHVAAGNCEAIQNLCNTDSKFAAFCKDEDGAFWSACLEANGWNFSIQFVRIYESMFPNKTRTKKDVFVACCRSGVSRWDASGVRLSRVDEGEGSDEGDEPSLNLQRVREAVRRLLDFEAHDFRWLGPDAPENTDESPFVGVDIVLYFLDVILSPDVPSQTKESWLNVNRQEEDDFHLLTCFHLLKSKFTDRLMTWPCVLAPGGRTPVEYYKAQTLWGLRSPEGMRRMLEWDMQTRILPTNTMNSVWLKSLICTLPPKVEWIGDNAFEHSKLELKLLPRGLQHIGEAAFATTFASCETLPDSVVHVGERAFENCPLLPVQFMRQLCDRGFECALGKRELLRLRSAVAASAVGALALPPFPPSLGGGPGEPPTKLADWRPRSSEKAEAERRLFSLLEELPPELQVLVAAHVASGDCEAIQALCSIDSRFVALCDASNDAFWTACLEFNGWSLVARFKSLYETRLQTSRKMSAKEVFAVCCRIGASKWDTSATFGVDSTRVEQSAERFLTFEKHDFDQLPKLHRPKNTPESPFVRFDDFAAFLDAVLSPLVPEETKECLLNVNMPVGMTRDRHWEERRQLSRLYLLRLYYCERLLTWPCIFAPGGHTPFKFYTGQALDCLGFEEPTRSLKRLSRDTTVIEEFQFCGENLSLLICVLPRELKRIEKTAFLHTVLELDMLPESLEFIGKLAFSKSTLRCRKLPEGLKHIGDGAFKGCDNVAFEVLPDSVESIGKEAFANCPSLPIQFLRQLWERNFQNAIGRSEWDRLHNPQHSLSDAPPASQALLE